MSGRITIVGCGPGSPDYLTEAAKLAVSQAKCALGARRLLELFPQAANRREISGHADKAVATIAEELARGDVAVLVSGDPGVFSLAQAVIKHFGLDECKVIPGVSSAQAAFASIGQPWANARFIHAHGEVPQLSAAQLKDDARIAIFLGGESAAAWAAEAANELAATHRAWLCRSLTLPDEEVRKLAAPVAKETLNKPNSILLLITKGQ